MWTQGKGKCYKTDFVKIYTTIVFKAKVDNQKLIFNLSKLNPNFVNNSNLFKFKSYGTCLLKKNPAVGSIWGHYVNFGFQCAHYSEHFDMRTMDIC